MQIIQSGSGVLIQPPDLNAFREWNRHKPKALIDKRMTEAEAVERFVHPGDYLGTELYGTVRCPMSLPEVTPEVRLALALRGEMSRQQLQQARELKDDEHFRKAYLLPALETGLTEMTIPDKPRSSRQKYRLTEKGHARLSQGGGR